ncbi:MAG TPA: glycosyltransferase family 4 protein [Chloroflexota bacterium]
MKVLIALTYYRPYVSGLTIYVERLARGLAERGHRVTVLTSRYDASLPPEEQMGGVSVVRVPVVARVSKGVLMPTLGLTAARLGQDHDVFSIHLPQFDAAGLAFRARGLGKPTVLTYHCDVQLPPGILNRLAGPMVTATNLIAGRLADAIVSYTRDYADYSPYLSRFRDKVVIIPPPVVMVTPSTEETAAFRRAHAIDDGPVVGFAARLAAEKGVEYLVAAMPALLQRFPRLKVLFAGPYHDVLGEAAYWRRLQPLIAALGEHWEFLGTLSPAEMGPFFGACDVLVVPSLNSTESFGLVQVEAMLCGTPSVASDLPGVRQPVRMTGMGAIVPVADAAGLADGIIEVLDHQDRYVRPRVEIEALFDVRETVAAYEALFQRQMDRRSPHGASAASS